jgi:hypothetical protein
MFSFGIEHEVAFVNCDGQFADFSCTKFNDFNQIIKLLPLYPKDHLQLRLGDAKIKEKRWYLEGFERLLDSDQVVDFVPKGIEIRTTIHTSIASTLVELIDSFNLLRTIASQFYFSPILISFNPYHTIFEPDPPLNNYESRRQKSSPEKQTEQLTMLTYGPDLNISMSGLSPEQLVDIGQKLTYYSPYIVPFSYSSPFYQGKLWSGLSVRTFMRTGKRTAVRVFVEKPEYLIKSVPSLTKIARIPAEIGRIEFKAFDSCDNFLIYGGLLALLKGLILDKSLTGRAIIPDAFLHQLSAQEGFNNPEIFAKSTEIFQAVQTALKDDSDLKWLDYLRTILESKQIKSHELIRHFNQLGSIEKALNQTYQVVEYPSLIR